jgi:hypothetical protein
MNRDRYLDRARALRLYAALAEAREATLGSPVAYYSDGSYTYRAGDGRRWRVYWRDGERQATPEAAS